MRRDIAILGMLHRAAIGDGPPQLRELFRIRTGSLRMEDPLESQSPSRLMQRSIWGAVRVYNSLGGALQCATVKDLQGMLQARCKRVVVGSVFADWVNLYSSR